MFYTSCERKAIRNQLEQYDNDSVQGIDKQSHNLGVIKKDKDIPGTTLQEITFDDYSNCLLNNVN